MASDAFMHLDDGTWIDSHGVEQEECIDGESEDAEFRNKRWFEIASLDWDLQPPDDDDDDDDETVKRIVMSLQKQRERSLHNKRDRLLWKKEGFQDFTVSKFIDRASPDLFRACVEKAKFKRAIIIVREAGAETRKTYLKFHFGDVIVKGVHCNLTPGEAEDDSREETVRFAFGKVCIEYLRQLPTGKHAAPKIRGWDFMNPEGPAPWGPTRT
jgi:type VI secretion system Hcp family effector